jgi:enoyl-CoA hydratase/carnithine racemase
VLDAAIELAEQLTRDSAPVAVALARRMLWTMLGAADPVDAHVLDSKGIFTLGRGPDAQDGVRAFLEKRDARFPLRVSTDLPDLWGDRA